MDVYIKKSEETRGKKMENVYTPAEIEIIRLENSDVITTSNTDPTDDPLNGTYNPGGWT